MPYAAEGRISHDVIDDGIEITDEQYAEALEGMLRGDLVSIDGGFSVAPPPEPEPEPELPAEQNPDWPALIAARRYQAEVAGVDVGGMRVDTDDRSKLLINGAALEAVIDSGYVMRWKTPDGFVDLAAQQVIAVARAVRAHVQACFDREAELLAMGDSITAAELEEGWP